MQNEKYRIREFNNKFTIEIEVENTITIRRFLRKSICEKVLSWELVGKDGRQGININIECIHYDNLLPPFNNIDDAKKQIEAFRKGLIYHYV